MHFQIDLSYLYFIITNESIYERTRITNTFSFIWYPRGGTLAAVYSDQFPLFKKRLLPLLAFAASLSSYYSNIRSTTLLDYLSYYRCSLSYYYNSRSCCFKPPKKPLPLPPLQTISIQSQERCTINTTVQYVHFTPRTNTNETQLCATTMRQSTSVFVRRSTGSIVLQVSSRVLFARHLAGRSNFTPAYLFVTGLVVHLSGRVFGRPLTT